MPRNLYALTARILIYLVVIPLAVLVLVPNRFDVIDLIRRGEWSPWERPPAKESSVPAPEVAPAVAPAVVAPVAPPRSAVVNTRLCTPDDAGIARDPSDARAYPWLMVLCSERGQLATGYWLPLAQTLAQMGQAAPAPPAAQSAALDALAAAPAAEPYLVAWLRTDSSFIVFSRLAIMGAGDELTPQAATLRARLLGLPVWRDVGIEQWSVHAGARSVEILLESTDRPAQRLLVLDVLGRAEADGPVVGVICSPQCLYDFPFLLMPVPDALRARHTATEGAQIEAGRVSENAQPGKN